MNPVDENGEAIGLEDTAQHINSFFAEIDPKLAEKHTLDWESQGVK